MNKRIKHIESIDVLDKKINQLYKDITTGKADKTNNAEDASSKEEKLVDWNEKLIEILLTGRSKNIVIWRK